MRQIQILCLHILLKLKSDTFSSFYVCLLKSIICPFLSFTSVYGDAPGFNQCGVVMLLDMAVCLPDSTTRDEPVRNVCTKNYCSKALVSDYLTLAHEL